MDDPLEMFLTGVRVFGDRVRAITEEQWSAPTPDTEWTVADLVEHLIDEHRWAAPLLHGLDLDSAAKVVEGSRRLPVDGGVGANFAELWSEAAIASVDAFTADGALDRSVALARGDTPARSYLGEMIFDLTVHAWDLAKAIGFPDPLPEDLVVHAYEQVAAAGDMSASGLFAAPVEVPDDAPIVHRLIAATGRDPR